MHACSGDVSSCCLVTRRNDMQSDNSSPAASDRFRIFIPFLLHVTCLWVEMTVDHSTLCVNKKKTADSKNEPVASNNIE